MKKFKKAGFILLEAIFGLGFAFISGYIFSFYDTGHITASVLNTFLIIFMSIIIGIGLIGYFHLRSLNKLAIFGKSLILSCLGLIAFLILYIVIISLFINFLPHYLSSVILPIFLPMTGAIIGFNFMTIKNK